MKSVLLVAILIPLISFQAQGFDGTYELVVNKKQEKKKNTRWTLAEWLQQKEKIRAMDMWLAMNSSSNPFEFYFGGSQASVNFADSELSETMTQGEVGAFASITGIEYQYNNTESFYQSRYMFTLRAFGTSQQSTNLSLSYGGLQHSESSLKFKTDFYKASLSLYLTQFFGIKAGKVWINEDQDRLNNSISGDEISGTVFIDFKALRIFGKYIKSNYKINNLSTERDGVLTGIQIYF
ncbi:MAG: hypothetical protein MK008_13780 [Bdellovibrionales bacterium]|nr:hypothetical protein [Bdellovibrionales bacterium]